MPAPDIIIDLVERFDRNIDSYKSGNYNETQVRNEFINPFFEALGWDVINKAGYAEAYKDVIHEYSLKTKDVAKAPDYLFRIGGTKKFFVEAKKPSVNLKDDISPAFQLRRYAWSAKLPLSILTDFEELAIYDCRIQPKKNDKSSTARIKYLTYKDYIDKWDEIESVFSKDTVLKGSFDKFAETSKGKRGTTQVDDAFLSEIEKWRELLARNLALRNSNLTNRQLNYSVQKIIDRIIFLRISEDRGIEDYGQLYSLLNGLNTYKRLQQIFTRADEKYNSGLFHFDEEKKRTDPPDEITPTLEIDDKVLKDIFKNLYYPDCPYEFSVLGTDILGHVYEQFLGKVIRLTAGHRAVIEEKPEVKKAGGVYYTPTYIVDYIVKNTVGKKLEEINKHHSGLDPESQRKLTEAQIKKIIKEASKLKILDPACGSGSFLLGAYQYLLDWHLKIYTSSVEQISNLFAKKAPPIYRTKTNDYRLTTNEKKRILLNNIYGVDIDNQAVEVTKLSLLLKVLEGETDETLNTQISMFKERALPDLSNNIKCGNSLIGPDFYDQMEMNFLDEEEKLRINVFDWETEFKEIMNAGGFDCVIGNPPYVRSQQIELYQKEYFSNSYEAAAYQPDTFAFFIEKGIKLIRKNGKLSFINPNGLLTNTDYSKLKEFILSNTLVNIIVDLKDGVFKNASVDTFILVTTKSNKNNKHHILIGEYYAKKHGNVFTPTNKVKQNYFLSFSKYQFNTGINSNSINLINKIDELTTSLEKIFIVKNGMKVRKEFVKDSQIDNRFEKFLYGRNIKPFQIDHDNKWVCYDKNLEKKYSNQAFRDRKIFEKVPKLLVRQVMGKDRIYTCYDEQQFFVDQSVYLLLPKDNQDDLYYYLGLLCSRLIAFYFSKTMADRKVTFPKIKGDQIKKLPLINIKNLSNKRIKNISYKSRNMTLLLKSILKTKTPQEKTAFQRQIEATDKQIDKLVYELYSLTEEEIKIVEESVKK